MDTQHAAYFRISCRVTTQYSSLTLCYLSANLILNCAKAAQLLNKASKVRSTELYEFVVQQPRFVHTSLASIMLAKRPQSTILKVDCAVVRTRANNP